MNRPTEHSVNALSNAPKQDLRTWLAHMEAANELHSFLAAQPNAPDAARLKAMEAEWRARAAQK